MYVVSLKGKNVFQGEEIVCTITRMDNLDRVCAYIKQKYSVEFEPLATRFTSYWWCFNNITDGRDISLIVESVYTEEDIESLLS